MAIQKYPITLTRNSYNGRDARKREEAIGHNRLAARAGEYVNDKGATWPQGTVRTIETYEIASALSATVDEVSAALGFENGITFER